MNLIKTIRSAALNGPLQKRDEVIIADDQSSPQSRQMLKDALGCKGLIGEVVRPAKLVYLPAPPGSPTGPQAMCNLGRAAAQRKWLAFLDSHMAFAPGWRDYPIEYVPHAEYRWMSPPQRLVKPETWKVPDTPVLWAGTRWHWQLARVGAMSCFNFDHVPIGSAVPGEPLIPMSGCYFIHSDLFDLVRGFACLHANHGMEFIMALKTWMATGFPPVTLWTLMVGHVATGRLQSLDRIRSGLLNGASTLAILCDWNAAKDWVGGWPGSMMQKRAEEFLKENREMLSSENVKFRSAVGRTFEDACRFYCIQHPREIHDESQRVISTAPGIKKFRVSRDSDYVEEV